MSALVPFALAYAVAVALVPFVVSYVRSAIRGAYVAPFGGTDRQSLTAADDVRAVVIAARKRERSLTERFLA